MALGVLVQLVRASSAARTDAPDGGMESSLVSCSTIGRVSQGRAEQPSRVPVGGRNASGALEERQRGLQVASVCSLHTCHQKRRYLCRPLRDGRGGLRRGA